MCIKQWKLIGLLDINGGFIYPEMLHNACTVWREEVLAEISPKYNLMVHRSVTNVCPDRLRGFRFVWSLSLPFPILSRQVSTAEQSVISLTKQTFWTKMHQNVFGSRAPTGPDGGAWALPHTLCRWGGPQNGPLGNGGQNRFAARE